MENNNLHHPLGVENYTFDILENDENYTLDILQNVENYTFDIVQSVENYTFHTRQNSILNATTNAPMEAMVPRNRFTIGGPTITLNAIRIFLGLTAIVGNFLIILCVSCFKGLRTTTNMLVVNLALVDLINGLRLRLLWDDECIAMHGNSGFFNVSEQSQKHGLVFCVPRKQLCDSADRAGPIHRGQVGAALPWYRH